MPNTIQALIAVYEAKFDAAESQLAVAEFHLKRARDGIDPEAVDLAEGWVETYSRQRDLYNAFLDDLTSLPGEILHATLTAQPPGYLEQCRLYLSARLAPYLDPLADALDLL